MIGIDGGLTVDHIVRVGESPHFYSLGGPGLYASLGARLIDGARVFLRAWLPTSQPQFASVLEAAGVDTSLCRSIAEVPKVWILDSPEGRRLVLTTPPHQVEIAGDDELANTPPQAIGTFFSSLDGLVLCSPGRRPVHVGGARVVGVDPEQRLTKEGSWRYWKDISAHPGTVLFPSRLQLSSWGSGALQAAERLREVLGVPVVARLDVEGAAVISGEGTWRVYDTQVQVTDTTGAGDAMAAATVSALASGLDIVTATAMGVSVARLAVAGWGHLGLAGQSPLARPFAGVRTEKG